MATTQATATSSKFTEDTYKDERTTKHLDFSHLGTEEEVLDALENMTELPNIVREGILLTGGAVAILLQAAKPGMSGAAEKGHNLAEQLFEGLRNCTLFMYGLCFGTRQERKRILDLLYSHRANATPGRYYPEDPKLRLWIAASFYAIGFELYHRLFEKVEYHRSERIYREYTILTVAMQLPANLWPEDRNSFWAYWDAEIERLQVDPFAKPIVHDLQSYNNIPGWVKWVRPFIRAITPEMLPPHIRAQYGLTSTKGSRFKYKFMIGSTKAIYPALPSVIRTRPMKRALTQLRAQINT